MDFINTILIILKNEPEVYLLFAGIFIISINFFIKKHWFKASFLYLIGCLWFVFYDFTFGFISNLEWIHFKKLSHLIKKIIFYIKTVFQIDLSYKLSSYQIKKFFYTI